MKLVLIKFIILFIVVFCSSVRANSSEAEYNIYVSGIKIGKLNWFLNIKDGKYETNINLESSGFFSPLYSFTGQYTSSGNVKSGVFNTKKYKQFWKTKKEVKIVEIKFEKNIVEILQIPKEDELSRIDLKNLLYYFDPITSLLNILNGSKEAKTVDGRRIYVMKKMITDNKNYTSLKIKDYKNIWADHNRNDLKNIDLYLGSENFFPEKILIYFKERIFKLRII